MKKKLNRFLAVMMIVATVGLTGCDKDDPQIPDPIENPSDNPNGGDTNEDPSQNPETPETPETPEPPVLPDNIAEELIGTWVSLTPELGMTSMEIRDDGAVLLMESPNLRDLHALFFAEAEYTLNKEEASLTYTNLRGLRNYGEGMYDYEDATRISIKFQKYRANEFVAEVTGWGESKTKTFHRQISTNLVKCGEIISLPEVKDFITESSIISVDPEVASVSDRSVEGKKYGTTFIKINTESGVAVVGFTVSPVTKLPFTKSTDLLYKLGYSSADLNNPAIIYPLHIDSFPKEYDYIEEISTSEIYNSTTTWDFYAVSVKFKKSVSSMALWHLLNRTYVYEKLYYGHNIWVPSDPDYFEYCIFKYGTRGHPSGYEIMWNPDGRCSNANEVSYWSDIAIQSR